MGRSSALAALAALGTIACAPPAHPAPAPPSLADWRRARAELAALRREASGGPRGGVEHVSSEPSPRTLRVAVAIEIPAAGRAVEARGAVAVDPPSALRMILLGPGGTTALDLWMRDDRYRLAVPAIDLVRRGNLAGDRRARRGMPVDFLRSWLVRPLEGELLWYARDAGGATFVLRDGASIVEVRTADVAVELRRTSFTSASPGAELVDIETIQADRLGCGRARYRQASTGLVVRVACEGEEASRAPDPRAFVDPDGEVGP
jgi:hypothetical protein